MSSSSSAFLRASAALTPAISMGKQIFFRQERCMSRLNCWKIMLMDRRCTMSSFSVMAHRSRPSMTTWPSVGRSSRLMHRTRVDLPAPLMPTMPNTSPSSTVMFTSVSALSSPSAVGNTLEMCFNSIIRITSLIKTFRFYFNKLNCMLKNPGCQGNGLTFPPPGLKILRFIRKGFCMISRYRVRI